MSTSSCVRCSSRSTTRTPGAVVAQLVRLRLLTQIGFDYYSVKTYATARELQAMTHEYKSEAEQS